MNARPRTAAVLLLALLIGPAILSGCADKTTGSSSSASPAAESAAEFSAESSAAPAVKDTVDDGSTAAPSFAADVDFDTAEPSADASVTVTDIRIGRHDGFDRVVFEVAGTGTPGWNVQYVDAPSSQGSGEPIDVAGHAPLQVTLTGAGYPYDTGVQEFPAGDPLAGSGTKIVTEAVYDSTYEGTSVAFVGTEKRTAFRVYLLDSPTRVVLEVADPS
jgi:hypothetical protein